MSAAKFRVDHDVVILGLGPVGAFLANLLGMCGVSTAVFERDRDVVPVPRAAGFDGEVMRVIQTIGLAGIIEPTLRYSSGIDIRGPGGEVLIHRPPADRAGPQGWRMNNTFYQPQFERILRDGIERYPSVSVFTGHEVDSVEAVGTGSAHDDHAMLRTRDIAGGESRTVTSRFVVGCDGARSLVRQQIGSGMTDLGLHETWVVVDVVLNSEAPRLPPHGTSFCHPTNAVVYLMATGNRRRFEFSVPPDEDARGAADPDRVWKVLSRWLTPDEAQIERAAVYVHHSLIADTWRRGPLLIAGDAAHQTPPFMGQGMCAGVRDAANLAWKLACVVQGRAPLELLDSYGPERIPNVRDFIEAAVMIGDVLACRSTNPVRSQANASGGAMPFPVIVPTLGPGVHDSSPGAGRISPQPLRGNGALLDDAIGYRFGLIGNAQALDQLGDDVRAQAAALGVATVIADGAVADWLAGQGKPLVLLRPDRYVMSSFDVGEANGVLQRLKSRTGGSPQLFRAASASALAE